MTLCQARILAIASVVLFLIVMISLIPDRSAPLPSQPLRPNLLVTIPFVARVDLEQTVPVPRRPSTSHDTPIFGGGSQVRYGWTR